MNPTSGYDQVALDTQNGSPRFALKPSTSEATSEKKAVNDITRDLQFLVNNDWGTYVLKVYYTG